MWTVLKTLESENFESNGNFHVTSIKFFIHRSSSFFLNILFKMYFYDNSSRIILNCS